jgi:hypothetical protein
MTTDFSIHSSVGIKVCRSEISLKCHESSYPLAPDWLASLELTQVRFQLCSPKPQQTPDTQHIGHFDTHLPFRRGSRNPRRKLSYNALNAQNRFQRTVIIQLALKKCPFPYCLRCYQPWQPEYQYGLLADRFDRRYRGELSPQALTFSKHKTSQCPPCLQR